MISTIIRLLIDYRVGLLEGLIQTLWLCLTIWSTGLILGTIFGVLAHRNPKAFGRPLKGITFFFASIPIIVVLFWAHYPLQEILGIVVNPFITAATILSIVNSVSIAQIVRDGLTEFPTQYSIAGKVCGMTPKEIFLSIELPIISRQIIPQLLTQQVNMLQMTLFASLISVEEIFRVAQHINSVTYKPIEIYTTLALFFIAICLPMNLFAAWLKSKYTRNISEK